jgi:hypothetical protein
MPHMRERKSDPDLEPVADPDELPAPELKGKDVPRPSQDAIEEPEPDVTTDEPTA